MSFRLKVTSDGTPSGTKVVNAETGEELVHVTDLKLHIDVKSTKLVVTVIDPVVECELSGEVKSAPREASSNCPACHG